MQKNKKIIQILILLIIFIITVFIDLIFNKLNIQFDLTENELYKISDGAKSITGALGRRIDAYCFAEDEGKTNVVCEFTRNFCKTSDKLSFTSKDPLKHPELTKKYTSNGGKISDKTVVFDNGERYRIIPYEEMFSYNYLTGQNNLFVAEELFCNAVVSLDKDRISGVAILTGHGETEDNGLKKRIENFGAKCDLIDIRNKEISGFDVLMIISPKADLTAGETQKLEDFLDSGGTLIAALDASDPYLENFESLLDEWGIAVRRDMVLSADADSIMGDQPYSVIGKLQPHPVTDSLIKNNIRPVFFASRSIVPEWEVRGGRRVSVLAETGENAAAVSMDDENKEENGKFSLLTLSQGEKGRIFAFGSNMFFGEELKVYNEDLLRNIITWSTGDNLPEEIPPKVISSGSIQVPKKDIVFWTAIFAIVVPAMIAAAGIITAIRRRRL